MFAYPPSRNCSLGPSPGLGRTYSRRSHLVGGNMSMAPKSPMRAVPDAAATRPEHRSDSSYANFGPYTPAVSMAHDRATTLVLIPAMTLGIVHFLVSSSNLYPLCVFHRALASTSVPGFGSPPERKNGEPMRLRTSHGVVSMRLIADAIVPPLTPPLAFPAWPTARTHSSPRSLKCLATAHAPKSHGTESYPTHETSLVPVALASASCFSIVSRMNVGSPVMSQ
mmetsp:Transcript_353/g.863  ORF Transcript_353/g.863 Transcript_353/m.863 type:complete len:224 (+) Transcript_353:420-1091(+)